MLVRGRQASARKQAFATFTTWEHLHGRELPSMNDRRPGSVLHRWPCPALHMAAQRQWAAANCVSAHAGGPLHRRAAIHVDDHLKREAGGVLQAQLGQLPEEHVAANAVRVQRGRRHKSHLQVGLLAACEPHSRVECYCEVWFLKPVGRYVRSRLYF